MAWITLTIPPDGPTMVVNTDHIVRIRPSSSGSLIYVVGQEDTFSVTESPDAILRQIINAGGQQA
jgi:hypothetical protein